MKSILITGGAGFIGSHLVNRLLSEGGWQITVVDDFNDFYDPAIKRAAVEPHGSNPDFKLIEAGDFYSASIFIVHVFTSLNPTRQQLFPLCPN